MGDLIGLSMYPQWEKGHTFENIAQLPSLAQAFPKTRIYIAETSYPADGDDQPESNYTATPEGQMHFLQDVLAAMESTLPEAQNGGALWWESNEHGDWRGLFDSDHVARPALLHGFRASGSKQLVSWI